MQTKVLLPLVVLCLFSAFSVWSVHNEGWTAVRSLLAIGWGRQIAVDLVLALSMFLVWMVPDAKKHGITAVPYVLAVCLLGSIGALAYLVHRGSRASVIPVSQQQVA